MYFLCKSTEECVPTKQQRYAKTNMGATASRDTKHTGSLDDYVDELPVDRENGLRHEQPFGFGQLGLACLFVSGQLHHA